MPSAVSRISPLAQNVSRRRRFRFEKIGMPDGVSAAQLRGTGAVVAGREMRVGNVCSSPRGGVDFGQPKARVEKNRAIIICEAARIPRLRFQASIEKSEDPSESVCARFFVVGSGRREILPSNFFTENRNLCYKHFCSPDSPAGPTPRERKRTVRKLAPPTAAYRRNPRRELRREGNFLYFFPL